MGNNINLHSKKSQLEYSMTGGGELTEVRDDECEDQTCLGNKKGRSEMQQKLQFQVSCGK